jgi:hypothetical protein
MFTSFRQFVGNKGGKAMKMTRFLLLNVRRIGDAGRAVEVDEHDGDGGHQQHRQDGDQRSTHTVLLDPESSEERSVALAVEVEDVGRDEGAALLAALKGRPIRGKHYDGDHGLGEA